MIRILAINPGSTSTKIAVYEDSKPVLLKTLRHSQEELAPFEKIVDQFEFRKSVILKELNSADITIDEIDAVVGRGGMLRPIESGVYEVNETMKADLIKGVSGEHASNLGGLIADNIAKEKEGCRAFIADPVVVDELTDVARITGHPLMPRESKFHALNHKAVAHKFANSVERPYKELNLIIAHLGGGISIGAHKKGKIVDVNNALDGFGPLAPERAGTVPAGRLIEVCFSGKYTMSEVKAMITGQGGLMAHLGTNQAHVATEWAQNGDEKAQLILYAIAYQVSKAIGGALTVLKGEVDGIILTGGMAQNKYMVDMIKEHVGFLGKITVYPGEDEMEALAISVLSALNGEREIKVY